MFDSSQCRDARQHRLIRPLLVVVIAAVVALLTGCPLEFEDLTEPQILNVTVDPSTISQSDIGTSKTFDAEISTANFDDELDPDSAQVFIGNEEQIAVPGDVHINGNVVLLTGIESTWFRDHNAPGDYDIGAFIASETESARALNQTIVTVE